MALTNAFIRNVKPLPKVKRYADATGNGLLLTVQPSGSKQWIQRTMISGKQRDLGLGSYPSVSLADARTQAWANKREIQLTGTLSVKTSPTVGELAAEYISLHSPSWSAGTLSAWNTTLDVHILPVLGHVRVSSVTVDDCLRLLVSKSNGTQGSVRQRLRTILDVALAKRLIDHNPCGDAIAVLLPKETRLESSPRHFESMPYADLPRFMAKVRAGRATISNLCLQLLIHTGVRHSEVRGAEWSEIDMDQALWNIPPERMKSRKAHIVPLTAQALEVIKRLPRTDSPLLFANTKNTGCISGTILTKTFRRYTSEYTLHGFRASLSTWAAECTSYPREIAEHALAHTVGSRVERCYQRSTLLEQRRELMGVWAEYLHK